MRKDTENIPGGTIMTNDNSIKLLLLPIVDSIQKNETFDKNWDSTMKMWI